MRTYKPREWPYKAAGARDSAAEHVAAGIVNTVALIETEDDPEKLKRLTKTLYNLENAIRHLESCGAKTSPP